MRILDSSGDTAVVWELDDVEAIRAAEEQFARLVTEERRMAFARPAGADAGDSELIRRFDPTAEEIVMVRAIQGG